MQLLTVTNPHYLRAWNRLFSWVRSLVCPKESVWKMGGGDPDAHFCSFFINILYPNIFLMVFLNSFWGFQKQYYKTKLSNKARSIVWFVRRHRLMCTWLISICCSNVWFAEFPIYRKKKSCTLCPNFGESCCLGWTVKYPFLLRYLAFFQIQHCILVKSQIPKMPLSDPAMGDN